MSTHTEDHRNNQRHRTLKAGTIAFAWFSVLSEIDQGAVLDANFEGMPGTSGTELSG